LISSRYSISSVSPIRSLPEVRPRSIPLRSSAPGARTAADRRWAFVVLDVRSAEAYAAGHVPGAASLPHRRITERNLAAYPPDVLFVVYCSGPHCNGADRAAVALARLGRPVEKMIGGMTGWKDEAFALETAR
jgi:rhodanese-related sulfurtransferase